MIDKVLRDQPHTFVSADERFKLCPLGFEPFLVLDFFAFGRLLEFLVQVGPLGIIELQFGQTAFVVDSEPLLRPSRRVRCRIR